MDLWRKRAVAVVLVAGATALGSALPALAAWTVMLVILAGVAVAEASDRPENDRLAA